MSIYSDLRFTLVNSIHINGDNLLCIFIYLQSEKNHISN